MAERRVGSFYARGADGTMYEVIEHQTEVVSRPLNRGAKLVPGPIRMALPDGRHVNPVDGDPMAFQIFDNGEIIRRL